MEVLLCQVYQSISHHHLTVSDESQESIQYTLPQDTQNRCFEVPFSEMDHSREVLKSHSEIYKVYGFLVQGETQSLSSADLPWSTRIGEYNTRPSSHHRESLQPSLSFGSSCNPTQRSRDRNVCVRGLGIQGDYGSMVKIPGVSYFVHTNQEDWVGQKKSCVAFCAK